MNFQPELAAKVMAGEKTVTRRALSSNPRSPWFMRKCSLVVGRDYAVCPGRSKPAIGRVVVLSVVKDWLAFVDDEEARREGFADRAAFMAGWEAINGAGSSRGPRMVWVVRFEVADRGSTVAA